jgi:hypothetical protein
MGGVVVEDDVDRPLATVNLRCSPIPDSGQRWLTTLQSIVDQHEKGLR